MYYYLIIIFNTNEFFREQVYSQVLFCSVTFKRFYELKRISMTTLGEREVPHFLPVFCNSVIIDQLSAIFVVRRDVVFLLITQITRKSCRIKRHFETETKSGSVILIPLKENMYKAVIHNSSSTVNLKLIKHLC